ncbi:hypothetical protein B0H13DRAFT_1862118 [Mycena leptocephala]|nr:hypothetical protein B0H13DRAFT_1862118 [Mycena leptocephala]
MFCQSARHIPMVQVFGRRRTGIPGLRNIYEVRTQRRNGISDGDFVADTKVTKIPDALRRGTKRKRGDDGDPVVTNSVADRGLGDAENPFILSSSPVREDEEHDDSFFPAPYLYLGSICFTSIPLAARQVPILVSDISPSLPFPWGGLILDSDLGGIGLPATFGRVLRVVFKPDSDLKPEVFWIRGQIDLYKSDAKPRVIIFVLHLLSLVKFWQCACGYECLMALQTSM